ncbi:Uncharacterized protein SAMN02746065_1442 [Desulfocicer vacuolatum DSM 3385]|uniref:Photosynthesis system II assembly factor Ycf48/Hcf136-like domain-containing protein n=1 Tax=Desulfocicer vacuolatum DSM 3385 TaxID=1121400 RepID=A0A1W2ETB6_9BACT|nr:YCF48-related protein [Desulfocicer vacuolatum]SMD12954.1 Uncharacterized protein SAMN02746065_1442 [Desulfocicer vacuolatum DSM 3385]
MKSKTMQGGFDFLKKIFKVSALLMLMVVFIPQMLSAREKFAQDLFSVSFPSESDGWACGRWGTIVHSSNGGESWHHQQSGIDFTLSSVYFVDSQNGWVVGDGGTILHTTDGGEHWEKQECPIDYFHMSVFFINARTGWIVSERTHILYTENGGESWQIQFNDQDFILKSISFCDEKNGWAVGEFGYIYHTKDGGKHWDQQAGEFGFSEETGEIVGGTFLYAVKAVDPSTAWASGIDGYISRTTNGGDFWEKVTGNGVPRTHIFGINADGFGRIIAGGVGHLITSTDYGSTFNAGDMAPSIVYGWVYGIAQRGPSGFVAVGKKGWIYLSDATGASWKRVAGE